MTISAFDHPWLSGLFADPAMAKIFSAEKQMAHMLAFEATWSRACGKVGLFDAAKAEDAACAIKAANIDFADIAVGMAQDGVPVPRLIKQLQATAPAEALHKGATSQDVVDTALAMTLRETSVLIAARLKRLEFRIKGLETRFGDNPLMARTRMQAATRITVRDRVLTWRLPMVGHLERLEMLRPKVEKVQIGGAAGDRRALGKKADDVVSEVAKSLGLAPAEKAWHAMREGVAEYASFLSLVTGSLGKMGQDIVLMSQQGVEEISLSVGGGSSAMPHKQNPIAAELLVTMARFNATQVAGMHHTMIHEQERSGSAWSLEWMILPQMAMATARALAVALDLTQNITRIGADEGNT